MTIERTPDASDPCAERPFTGVLQGCGEAKQDPTCANSTPGVTVFRELKINK